MSCRACGAALPDGARFCSNCGASQTVADEERRIVTALFADIVGFTGLAEHRDPEEVKHLVDRCFAEIADDITTFGGKVDKIVGDQIVALFGAPVAHEDDAERAVRAALRMQPALERMGGDLETAVRVRIGVNTGEVLVGSTTAGGDYTAMGDVMNSAARLQELAEPGQVLVGSSTKAATTSAVNYRPAGRLPARGREDPLEAWVAVEAVGAPGAHRRRVGAFVGRDRELAFLDAQAAMALELSRAQVSVVLGEPGMGKSRLIQEASERLARCHEIPVIEGRCVPYGEANVWWPVAELVRDLFTIGHDLTPASTEVALRAALDERFGVDHPDGPRLFTALKHTLGLETPLRGGSRSRNRSEVTLAVTQVIERAVLDRPLIVVLSDMHWAANAVWGLLDHLLRSLARQPLILMMSARDLGEADLFEGRHGVSVLPLGPLADQPAHNLLNDLGFGLSRGEAEGLVTRSGGNPYFLEELAGLVIEGGSVGRAVSAAGGDRTAADLDELPDTLRGIVAARLDSLAPEERGLLEDASVLGRTGTVVGLTTLVTESRGVEDMAGLLERLVALDLLSIDGPRYEFRSDLVRDVAYGTLTKTVRAQRHAGIATYLESAQTGRVRSAVVAAIAEHYRAAAQLLGELSVVPGLERAEVVSKALLWLDRAGDRALKAGEPVAAEKWYDYGVALAEDDQALSGFLYGRAKARCEIHNITGSRADLDRLEPLTDHDPVLAAKALLVRGDVHRKAGDLDHAASKLREAADRLAVLDVPDEQALALRLLGITEMERSDDSLARQALASSRLVAAKAGDRRSEGWALQSMAWHEFNRGRTADANDLVEQAVEIFAELGDRGGLAWAQGVQAWVAFHLGHWERAEQLVDSVLPETRRRGDPWAEAVMVNLSASLALWSGRAGEALRLAQDGQAIAGRADDLPNLVGSMALEGRALVSLGRVADGTHLLEQAFAIADRRADRDTRRIAIISNCASAARLGEPERAIRWAARFDGVHDDPTVVGEADLVVSLALAMLQRGAVDEAAAQLSWVEDPDADPDRNTNYEEAVGALIAAAAHQSDVVDSRAANVLTGSSTYLDRVFALGAKAAVRQQEGDEAGAGAALARARDQVESTDDQVTRLLLDLLAAVLGRGSLVDADRNLRSIGLDPTGWRTCWELVVGGRVVT